jgi:hypothetical protein
MVEIPAIQGYINYSYSPTGERLQASYRWRTGYSLDPLENTLWPPAVTTAATLTRDYVGNKIYENKVLKKILLPNGYIENNNYYFYLRDHLGSTAVTANATSKAIQSLRYYPYGKVISRDSYGIPNSNVQPYKFGVKEEESRHEMELLDFHNQ